VKTGKNVTYLYRNTHEYYADDVDGEEEEEEEDKKVAW
jgi:hypothetical protein